MLACFCGCLLCCFWCFVVVQMVSVLDLRFRVFSLWFCVFCFGVCLEFCLLFTDVDCACYFGLRSVVLGFACFLGLVLVVWWVWCLCCFCFVILSFVILLTLCVVILFSMGVSFLVGFCGSSTMLYGLVFDFL